MGSIGGRSALPFLGPYAASKHALEAFADVASRRAARRSGISVSIVEPASVKHGDLDEGAARARTMLQSRLRARCRGALRRADRRVPVGRAEPRPRRRSGRGREGGRARAHGVAPEGALHRRSGRPPPRVDRAAPDPTPRPPAREGASRLDLLLSTSSTRRACGISIRPSATTRLHIASSRALKASASLRLSNSSSMSTQFGSSTSRMIRYRRTPPCSRPTGSLSKAAFHDS